MASVELSRESDITFLRLLADEFEEHGSGMHTHRRAALAHSFTPAALRMIANKMKDD